MSICSVFIALGLFVAGEIYNRRAAFNAGLLAKVAILALLAGIVSGGVAQGLFSFLLTSGPNLTRFKLYSCQIACWGVAGTLSSRWMFIGRMHRDCYGRSTARQTA